MGEKNCKQSKIIMSVRYVSSVSHPEASTLFIYESKVTALYFIDVLNKIKKKQKCCICFLYSLPSGKHIFIYF